jgi:hypothetical protein
MKMDATRAVFRLVGVLALAAGATLYATGNNDGLVLAGLGALLLGISFALGGGRQG